MALSGDGVGVPPETETACFWSTACQELCSLGTAGRLVAFSFVTFDHRSSGSGTRLSVQDDYTQNAVTNRKLDAKMKATSRSALRWLERQSIHHRSKQRYNDGHFAVHQYTSHASQGQARGLHHCIIGIWLDRVNSCWGGTQHEISHGAFEVFGAKSLLQSLLQLKSTHSPNQQAHLAHCAVEW